jgi:prepilin-type N-terminal cleavage/methylation domain-containing protein
MNKIERAFTLAELMVVVGIIAVLIALLLPTLNKAKYQAKVAACQAKLSGLGHGMITYATDYWGSYPMAVDPPDNNPSSWFWTTWQRSWEWSKRGNPSVYDLRPVYREYLGGELDKTAKCPMAAPYFADRKIDDQHLSNYMLYPTNNHETKHFYFANEDAPIVSSRLNKTWSVEAERELEFRLLASDASFGNMYGYGGGSMAGHPAPNGFDRPVGGPINDFPGHGIGYWDNPIYKVQLNYLDGDGAVHMYHVDASAKFDADTWVRVQNYNVLIPRDLAR